MTAFSFLLAFDVGDSPQEKQVLSHFVLTPRLTEASKLARKLAERKNPQILFLFWQQASISFPQWGSARVCYAETLLKYGLLDSAWIALILSPVRLQDNPKAIHLLEKIAWILGYENLCGQIRAYWKRSAWVETELAGMEMWEKKEGESLCKAFREFLSEDTMIEEFKKFCM